jgi:hypothetical protein
VARSDEFDLPGRTAVATWSSAFGFASTMRRNHIGGHFDEL